MKKSVSTGNFTINGINGLKIHSIITDVVKFMKENLSGNYIIYFMGASVPQHPVYHLASNVYK